MGGAPFQTYDGERDVEGPGVRRVRDRAADPAEASDLRLCLQDVLDGLAPLDRAVLVLRYSEDLGVSEVADLLGLTPGAVKNRTMRALERARERTPQ